MPVYEYRCQDEKCGEFEIEQKMNDPHLENCPKCGKEKPTRLISKSTFKLLGGGWGSSGYS